MGLGSQPASEIEVEPVPHGLWLLRGLSSSRSLSRDVPVATWARR